MAHSSEQNNFPNIENSSIKSIDISKLLSFLHEIGKLKQLLRKGWVRHNIPQPESVAAHSFRLSLMAQILAPALGLDVGRCLQMAIIHDIAESQIGDITPHDPITPQKKIEIEHQAMQNLINLLPDRATILNLWQEYLAQETLESKFVNQLDKLEMVLQAKEYQKDNPTADLKEFWNSTKGIWTFDELKKIYDTLVL